jgi:prostamide/prostaglandin F2alpha synthase
MSLAPYVSTVITNARNPSEAIRLEELWKDSTCVLLFLRRLGCPLCRSYVKLIEAARADLEATGARVVCLSFEAFGEGSDSDRSFERGGFWSGPIYTVDKSVYQELFGRKGLMNGFFGLLDIKKEALARSKATPGNFKGDGFQLGGQFIVAKGGAILLEHRQKAFGDDATIKEILDAVVKGGSQ